MKNIRIVLIILALLVLAAVTGKSQTGVDPGNPDTLYIDSVVAYTSGIAIVPVSFYNDESLDAVEITLIHNSLDVTIDSFSFAGGRLAALTDASRGWAVKESGTIITIYTLAYQNLIPPGEGLAGNIYFSFAPGILPQLVNIDTITYTAPNLIEYATTFKDSTPLPALPFIPQVVKGYVDIQETPATLDSVWVENIVTNPKKQISVDLNLYNERNTKNVSVALDYGNDSLIHLDSVVFTGTRGNIANKNFQFNRGEHMLWVLLDYETTPLATGSGPLFTMHFTVDSLINDTTLIIDSTTYFTEGNNIFLVLTSLDGGEMIKPIFNFGEIDIDIITGVEDITDEGQLPATYTLAQNYPNPFNPTTEIEFSLPTAGDVTLEVFNILGQNVRRLVDQKLSAGVHRVTFDGRTDRNQPLASGIYLYRLTSNDFTQSRKMILLK